MFINKKMKNEKQNDTNNIIDQNISIKMKYYKGFQKFYEEINKKLLKNIVKIPQLKNKYIQNIINDDEESILLITNNIIEVYKNILSNFQKLFEFIFTKLTNYLNEYNQLQIKYDEFEEIKKVYIKKNKRVKELKNEYHQNGKELEKMVIKMFENNDNNSSLELDKLLNKTKDTLNKYKKKVTKINKYIFEYNEKLNDLMENITQFNKIFLYDSIKEEFYNYLGKTILIISTLLDENNEEKLNKKKKKNLKNININNNAKNLEKEDIIHFPSSINFEEYYEEEDYLIYIKTIKFLKKSLDDKTLYKNYDPEKEKIKNENSKIIIPFFDNIKYNLEITDENKNKLINILKEPSFHNLFLTIMSKFRTNNERSKNWINLMGECLNLILNISLKDNKYDNIKNCIILSQTYYYKEENNNNKIYISQIIEEKQIFKDYIFWKDLIDINIIKQLEFYQSHNNLIDVDLVKGIGLTPNLIKKKGEIIFTQLLPFVNNMISFKMDKNKIINIVDYFKEKYVYLAKEDYKAIISMITNAK